MDSPTPPDELPDKTAKATPTSEAVPEPPDPPELRRRALADVLLVAGVYLLPNVYNAIAGWFQPVVKQSLVQAELSLAVQATAYSVLGLYLILRSGEPPATFGLSRPRVSDLFLGLTLWLGVFVMQYVAGAIIPQNLFGLPSRFTADFLPPPRTPLDYALVAMASCLNGFGEEVVMRAVLQTRLERLMRSAPSAIMLTSILFALYHAYYGLAGVLEIWLFGLAVGIVFRLRKCLWPVVIAHAMQDFAPMVWYADVTK